MARTIPSKILAFLSHPWLVLTCRLGLAFVFLLSSWGKLYEPIKFLGAVEQYQILPALLVPLFAVSLPGVEFAAAIGVLLPKTWRAAMYLIIAMILMFLTALISVMLRKIEIDCSCFDMLGVKESLLKLGLSLKMITDTTLQEQGADLALVGWRTIARDGAFLLLCLPVFFRSRDKS